MWSQLASTTTGSRGRGAPASPNKEGEPTPSHAWGGYRPTRPENPGDGQTCSSAGVPRAGFEAARDSSAGCRRPGVARRGQVHATAGDHRPVPGCPVGLVTVLRRQAGMTARRAMSACRLIASQPSRSATLGQVRTVRSRSLRSPLPPGAPANAGATGCAFGFFAGVGNLVSSGQAIAL